MEVKEEEGIKQNEIGPNLQAHPESPCHKDTSVLLICDKINYIWLKHNLYMPSLHFNLHANEL